MLFVTRAQWGARPPKSVVRITLPTPRVWVHHTATEQHGAAGVRAIQAFHMDTRGWADIAYSFLVDDDGTVFEGRGAGVAGGHTQGDNSRSHAICLMGNFDTRPPTTAALNATAALARHGRDAGWWVPTLGGHRDAPGALTACPGRHLYAALGHLRGLLDQPTQPVQIEEDTVQLIDFVRDPRTGSIYIVTPTEKRPIPNMTHLEHMQAHYAAKGVDVTVQAWDPADIDPIPTTSPAGDVDETEVARQVLAVLTPEAIAAAIPAEVAQGVADVLADRLAG